MRKPCEACGGTGTVIAGTGLAALEARYPDLPIREMERRGWFGDVGDGEDDARCDRGFLLLWNAHSHEEVETKIARGRARMF